MASANDREHRQDSFQPATPVVAGTVVFPPEDVATILVEILESNHEFAATMAIDQAPPSCNLTLAIG